MTWSAAVVLTFLRLTLIILKIRKTNRTIILAGPNLFCVIDDDQIEKIECIAKAD